MVLAIATFLKDAPTEDRILALKLLCTQKQPALLSMKKLMQWGIAYKDLPEWIIKKCHATVGDWAETMSLVLGKPHVRLHMDGLAEFISHYHSIGKAEEPLKSFLHHQWETRSPNELFIIHKLLTGTLKPMYSKPQLSNIIHKIYGIDANLINLRLSQQTGVDFTFDQLIDPVWSDLELSTKPFVGQRPETIQLNLFHFADPTEWVVEDFIHGVLLQVHLHAGVVTVWDLHNDGIAEEWFERLKDLKLMPDHSVVDILVISEASSRADKMILIDIHRWAGTKKSALGSLERRKQILQDWSASINEPSYILLPHLPYEVWSQDQRQLSSGKGWLVKHKHSGQTRYRIKPPNHAAHLQLLYAEYLNQNSAIEYNLTLGARSGPTDFIPVCKVHSDQLPASDKMALYYWIQNNLVQRFGPVRSVRGGQIFTITYDRVEINNRVKAGLQLIHVQVIQRFESGAKSQEITSLENIKLLLQDQI